MVPAQFADTCAPSRHAVIVNALVPAFFAAEVQGAIDNRAVIGISMACAMFNLTYMWLMIAGLDPMAFKGLTQRVSTLVIMGWYALAAYALVQATGAAPLSPGDRRPSELPDHGSVARSR